MAAGGKDAVEGLITVLYADPQNAPYRGLVEAYKKNVGQDPNEIVVTFYDAAQVLLKAIQIAGDPSDTTKVAEAFHQALPMKSLQGDTLTLGQQQIMTVDYVAEIRNGEPTVLGKLQQ